MNLLTDIIRDIAISYGMRLTKDEELYLQDEVRKSIIGTVSLLKDQKVLSETFPWMERRPSQEVV